MALSLDKIEREAPALLSLAKEAQTAVAKHGLNGQVAKCALILDASGSARQLYRSGAIQAAAERTLAVSTQFDDDGSIDVFFFHDKAWHAGELSISDYQGGIDRLFGRSGFGTTDYALAFDSVTDHYFKGGMFKRPDLSVPVFAAFFTDGRPNRGTEGKALAAARRSAERPIFFQSVGMGNAAEFDFIAGVGQYAAPGKSLNNHGGKVDNFGFVTYPDIAAVPDTVLLDGLLNEFPGALNSMRAAGTLR